MRLSIFTVLVFAFGGIALAAEPDPAALAARIDAHLAKGWQRAGIEPSSTIDDATFLRRASLDLIGRIPTVAETQAFLGESSNALSQAERRAALVDRLIQSGGHSRHFATVWRRIWVPQTDTPEFARLTSDFENWAAVRLRDNVPYDQLVREMLTASRVRARPNPAQPADVTPIGFQAASLFRAENLAANTTRAFLGLNLDCAQCHDHPFSRWTRDQFWETAAFFAAPQLSQSGKLTLLEVMIPDTERKLNPKLLDNEVPKFPDELQDQTGRQVLSQWIVRPDNPYFARNAVNRLWAQIFGRGLVEPLDDLSEDNPSCNPDLHQELAAAFVQSGYDLKYLTRAFVRTRAYQVSTVSHGLAPPEELRLFEKMPVRALTGEQLYDSLVVAAGLPIVRNDLLNSNQQNRRDQFAAQMHIERAVDAERSIVQSLELMNGSLTRELTSLEQSAILAAASDSPFLNQHEKVEMLFFSALNRRPTAAEAARLFKGLPDTDKTAEQQGLANIFWALLNSSEFNTNH